MWMNAECCLSLLNIVPDAAAAFCFTDSHGLLYAKVIFMEGPYSSVLGAPEHLFLCLGYWHGARVCIERARCGTSESFTLRTIVC